MTPQLTPLQEGAYRYIIRFKAEHDGNSPTIRDIMRATGYQSTSAVLAALTALERRGLIARLPGRALGIVVVGGEWRMGGTA